MNVFLATVVLAEPNWVYIGYETPKWRTPPYKASHAEWLAREIMRWSPQCKIIFKSSCGPELFARNEGVTLP